MSDELLPRAETVIVDGAYNRTRNVGVIVMALEVGPFRRTSDDLAKGLRVSGRGAIRPLVRRALVAGYSKEHGIEASVDELQAAADQFRVDQQLYTIADTKRWLEANGLTLDDFEAQVKTKVLADKIKASWSEEDLARIFAERKTDFDTVEISILVVPDEALAAEICAQIIEDEAEFMVLARDHSMHSNAKFGGYMGHVHRNELTGPVAAAVFSAQTGEVVGPFETSEGYKLVFVHEHHPAQLDAETREALRELLFHEWLRDREEKANPKWTM